MMDGNHVWLRGTLALMAAFGVCSGNQMAPHVFPSTGPFFESWYVRIMNQHEGVSVGFVITRIQVDSGHNFQREHHCIRPSLSPTAMICPEHFLSPKKPQQQFAFDSQSYNITLSRPYHDYAQILLSQNKSSKFISHAKYFPIEQFSVTQDGHPITKNPDYKTPPHFEVRIGHNLTFIVRPNGTKFAMTLGDTTLQGETNSPVSWGPDGENAKGPITDQLPQFFHWFVYSIRSNVVHYQLVNKPLGINIRGGSSTEKPVVAHLEKNWGSSFPTTWIWAQGVEVRTNASFLASVMDVTEFGVSRVVHAASYTNPHKGIHCTFYWRNSKLSTLKQDVCAGNVRLRVTSLFCDVLFEMDTQATYLRHCLTNPVRSGFASGRVESYNAVANITVLERQGLKMEYSDSKMFTMSSVRFEGDYIMCNGKCPLSSK